MRTYLVLKPSLPGSQWLKIPSLLERIIFSLTMAFQSDAMDVEEMASGSASRRITRHFVPAWQRHQLWALKSICGSLPTEVRAPKPL